MTASLGGVTVTLTVNPARAELGAAVGFTLEIRAASATGALAYRLYYGDGMSAENVVPLFCLASPRASTHASWHLSHRYEKVGSYRVLAVGSVNCSSSRAAIGTAVVISGRSG